MKYFIDLKNDYNLCHPDLQCPENILLSDNANDWLQKYILGTRKKDGERYPPKTLFVVYIAT